MAAVIPSIGQFNWGADLNDFLATLASREKPEVFKNKNLSDVSNKFPAALSPIGSIVDWTGANAPSGWRFCDGATLQRSAYPDLFNQIGTIHGAGDGTTTFALPKMFGRSLEWPELPAAAGWSVDNTVGWYRDDRTIRLRGRIRRNAGNIGANDVFVVLPSPLRPSVSRSTSYATGSGSSVLNINVNGGVTPQVAVGAGTVVFDGISWDVDTWDSGLPIQRIIRTN